MCAFKLSSFRCFVDHYVRHKNVVAFYFIIYVFILKVSFLENIIWKHCDFDFLEFYFDVITSFYSQKNEFNLIF